MIKGSIGVQLGEISLHLSGFEVTTLLIRPFSLTTLSDQEDQGVAPVGPASCVTAPFLSGRRFGEATAIEKQKNVFPSLLQSANMHKSS